MENLLGVLNVVDWLEKTETIHPIVHHVKKING